MLQTQITLPELMLVAGTRGMLGAGLGLLLADRVSDDRRRTIGWTLFLVGAVTTIPLAFEMFGKMRSIGPERWTKREQDDEPAWSDSLGHHV